MRHNYIQGLIVTGLIWSSLTTGSAIGVEFNEIARFNASLAFASDLDPEDTILDDNPKFIGTNPLGVAWNGSQLYLAGFDNSGSSLLPIGLVEILDPTRTGAIVVSDGDLSDKFGSIFQPSGRGYTGLAISGDRLAASYDGGTGTQTGIQVFDTTDNSLLWDLSASGTNARGGSGVAFDPGFGGSSAGAGVAWTTFGSGRRGLLDADNGGQIHDLTSGMQWSSDTASSFFARDLAFDPETGDIYARRSNDVDAADRTGDNSTENRRTIVDNGSNAAFVIGQKIAFLSDTSEGDLLIYNDRSSNAADQLFTDVIRVVDTDGVAQTATFHLLDGGTEFDLPDGSGIYDFDFDPVSQTMAMMDFSSRRVHIFEVGGLMMDVAGDLNGDSSINFGDLNGFVLALTDAATYESTFPGLDRVARCDASGDGSCNFGDLQPFVTLLTGGGTGAGAAAVPEPTSGWLLVCATFGLVRRRR